MAKNRTLRERLLTAPAGAGTGELVQRNDKAWSYSTTTVSPLVPGDGGSASCAARRQYSRHDSFARYAAEDRLLTEPIQPLRALQGRKISLNLRRTLKFTSSGFETE
jgi:hypothetical protein